MNHNLAPLSSPDLAEALGSSQHHQSSAEPEGTDGKFVIAAGLLYYVHLIIFFCLFCLTVIFLIQKHNKEIKIHYYHRWCEYTTIRRKLRLVPENDLN